MIECLLFEMSNFLILKETWGIQCQFYHFILFLALNAIFGIPCRVWHLMHEMALNAKKGIVLQFCLENVLIPMQRVIKC